MSHENCCEEFCCKAAERIAGPMPSGDANNDAGVSAPNLTSLIELIMQIVTTLMGNCRSSSDAKTVERIRNPGFLARGRFKSLVYKSCDQCYTYQWRDKSGTVAQAVIDQAQESTDAELLAVLFHEQNEDWLAI